MKFIWSLIAVLCLASIASAQDEGPTRFVESYNEVVGGHLSPSITVYAEGPIKGRFGWAVWVWGSNQLVEDNNRWSTSKWGESLGGLTFSPTESVQLAVLVGAETDERPLRGAANLWVSKGRLTLESSYENGGSGYWFRHTGTVKLASWKLGVNSTRFVGTGPYVEKAFGRWDLWGSYAVKGHGGSVGLRRNF